MFQLVAYAAQDVCLRIHSMEENKELFDTIRDILHEPGCRCPKCIRLRLMREREACEEFCDMNGTSIFQEEDI